MMRILVIDDEDIVRGAICAVLSAAGHAVSLAVDGQDGLDQLAGAEFDLVITDLIMPGMEGIETIMTIRKQSKGLRILAISGGGRSHAVNFLDAAGKLGADAALRKPFTDEQLLDAVECAVRHPKPIHQAQN